MLSEKTLSLQKNKYNSKISINDETEHYDAKNVVSTFGYILLFAVVRYAVCTNRWHATAGVEQRAEDVARRQI